MNSKLRRMCQNLFNSLMPTTAQLPGMEKIPLENFWQDFSQSAPPMLKLGLGFAAIYLSLRPIFSLKFLRPFAWLSPAKQEQFLIQCNESGFYFERQLIVTIKAVACMAYFDHPRIRELVE